MLYNPLHSFDLTKDAMYALQSNLRAKICLQPLSKQPQILSGFDISYGKEYAVAVLATFDVDLNVLEVISTVGKPQFDYTPGLLAFRELPLFLETWEKATIRPDVVFFDGNGIFHENNMGEATHASLFIDLPTIGVAKNFYGYIGEHADVASPVGSYQPITHNGQVLGAAVRTMKKANPVYVSVGNYITLEESIDLTLRYTAFKSKNCQLTWFADQHSRNLLAELES